MSDNNQGRKSTVFLTKEDGRAPSAYHIDQQSHSQRVRQEHRHGPTVTSEKLRYQAFTTTKHMAKAVSSLVQQDSQRLGVSNEFALRMQIMDGLVTPTIRAGSAHLEVSTGAFGKGNPHVSGGTVMFPQQGSPLSDFTQLEATTNQRRQQTKQHQPVSPPVTTSMSQQITPQAQAFNQQALKDQRSFVKKFFGSD